MLTPATRDAVMNTTDTLADKLARQLRDEELRLACMAACAHWACAKRRASAEGSAASGQPSLFSQPASLRQAAPGGVGEGRLQAVKGWRAGTSLLPGSAAVSLLLLLSHPNTPGILKTCGRRRQPQCSAAPEGRVARGCAPAPAAARHGCSQLPARTGTRPAGNH